MRQKRFWKEISFYPGRFRELRISKKKAIGIAFRECCDFWRNPSRADRSGNTVDWQSPIHPLSVPSLQVGMAVVEMSVYFSSRRFDRRKL